MQFAVSCWFCYPPFLSQFVIRRGARSSQFYLRCANSQQKQFHDTWHAEQVHTKLLYYYYVLIQSIQLKKKKKVMALTDGLEVLNVGFSLIFDWIIILHHIYHKTDASWDLNLHSVLGTICSSRRNYLVWETMYSEIGLDITIKIMLVSEGF